MMGIHFNGLFRGAAMHNPLKCGVLEERVSVDDTLRPSSQESRSRPFDGHSAAREVLETYIPQVAMRIRFHESLV